MSATLWLGARALRSWREQRAALAYELPASYRGTALRAAAALMAAGCALAGGSQIASGRFQNWPADQLRSELRSRAGVAGMAADSVPVRSATASASAAAAAVVRPSAAVRPKAPGAVRPAPAAGLLTVGRPAGGELREGTLAGYPGRVRIWLPPQYPHRTHPLQALVVLAGQQELPDILEGLAEAASANRANPFVVVAPEAVPVPDGARLCGAVAQQFHVEPSARSWGVLGMGAGASAAVAAELAHPEAYAAGVGLGGRYDGLGRDVLGPAASTGRGGAVRLLLADTARDLAGQASAARLRHALAGAAPWIRLSDTVRDLDDRSERVRLARQAAGYLAELMAAGTRP
ncbi:hypothetical protein GXW82_30460 [Streptacidiphilus sp. 4-A2]|nr:hypothetical protein [Streptacidiphilus sp. 4-A2]